MKSGPFSLVLAAATLASLALLPPVWHFPAGVLGWVVLRLSCADVHRTFGRPRRWLVALASLTILGAVFGPTDAHAGSLPYSYSGALAGTTMVVRAFALVALASVASASLSLRRRIQGIQHPFVRRIMAVAVIAANLVPVQLRALAVASTTLRERRPGLRRLPRRAWLLSIHCALRATALAEGVAFDMAIAAHNSGRATKEIK